MFNQLWFNIAFKPLQKEKKNININDDHSNNYSNDVACDFPISINCKINVCIPLIHI